MLNSVFWTVMALAMTALGLVLLYTSWRRHLQRYRRLFAVLSGWVLLAVVAVSCWVTAAGVEFGVSLSLMAPTCIALLVLIREWRRTAGSAARDRSKQRKDPPAQRITTPMLAGMADSTRAVARGELLRWLRHFGRFVLVVPVSALSALLISVALSRLLPLGTFNDMLAAVFVVPVLWGIIAYWMLADPRGLRPVAITLAVALVSSTVLLI